MFINYSNHASEKWSENQIKEAEKYGKIVDIGFANVPSAYDREEVLKLAQKECQKIYSIIEGTVEASVVMCQGEFTLSYALIGMLKEKGVKVVAGVSERVVTERIVNGKTLKSSTFDFKGFREY